MCPAKGEVSLSNENIKDKISPGGFVDELMRTSSKIEPLSRIFWPLVVE
jgi:hypothetical protein